MAETVTIAAEDGHRFEAYLAEAQGQARGAVVVVQEIFGVNVHIRDVCDRFADEGFSAIAPAVFDRIETGVEYGYDEAGIVAGREIVGKLGIDGPLIDIKAAAGHVRPGGRAGVVGFCWGGSVAWLAACRLDIGAAVGYYGRLIVDHLGEIPMSPTMLHFGDKDPLIPAADVAAIRADFPEIPVYVYPAGHGFNCDRRADFDATSAALAWQRTIAFFAANLA